MDKKDWNGNANSIFKQIGASNHCEDEREQNDYYATDPKAIDDLLKYESFNHNIWECASGGGHLVNKLKEHGYNVWSTDLINRGCQDELIDFISPLYNNVEEFDGDIITNPPYKFCTDFIITALNKIKDGHKVAMFLKLTTLEGQDRYERLYSKFPPKTIYIYIKRIQCAKNGEFTLYKRMSAVCYAWFVWEKGYSGPTILKWI